MSLLEKPSIYNQPSVYNQAGKKNKILQAPDGGSFIEYYILSANANGYFIFTQNDGIEILKDDIVYWKFECDLSTNFSFKLCEAWFNNSSLEFWKLSNPQTYNITKNDASGRKTTSVTFPAGNKINTIRRTKDGFFGDGWSIAHASTRDKVYLLRYMLPGNKPINVHTGKITDKDDVIKYTLLPFRNSNNDVGLYIPELDIIKYPNTQSGFSPGPDVAY